MPKGGNEGIIQSGGRIGAGALAVGRGARAANSSNLAGEQAEKPIDVGRLADDLAKLYSALLSKSRGTAEHKRVIDTIEKAESAAAKGQGPAALAYLKSAGTWALGIAEKIGVSVATEAIKRMTLPG